jgi:serine/threonine protein kinase
MVSVVAVNSRSCVCACQHVLGGARYAAKFSSDGDSIALEASVLVQLQGICGVPMLYACGYADGIPLLLTKGVGVDARRYAYQYLEQNGSQCRSGESVRWGLPDAILHQMVTDLVATLLAIHREGWLHRDVCPRNILLLEGRWCLCDFGSAGRIGASDFDRALQRRTFVAQLEFSSERLLKSSAALTPDDDFESLLYTLTFLHDVVAWEASVSSAGTRPREESLRALVDDARKVVI